MANQLQEIMEIANAGRTLNKPKTKTQKIFDPQTGTYKELEYQEDRFGRRTVMTTDGPRVMQGHEGKDPQGDLGNLLGGMINSGRLKRQERIAKKSVAEQEMAAPTFAGAKAYGSAPYVPSNQAELQKARERLEPPAAVKENYFDMKSFRTKPALTATQEKINLALAQINPGVSFSGGIVNGRETTRADAEQLKLAMAHLKKTSGSPTTYHTGVGFKDGSVRTTNNAGGLTYTDRFGKVFNPKDEGYAAAVERSVKSGIEYAGDKAFSTDQGKLRSEQEATVTQQITAAEEKQGIYKEMIQALDDGAQSGYFEDKLPSLSAASITLDNLQAQLGLNVIANTTFGALSESELRFALSSAAPMSLEPEALRAWITRKQVAQEKLISYMYDVGEHIRGGGTVGSWKDKMMRKTKGQTVSNLDFLPEEKRADAAKALKDGTATLQQLREMYPEGNKP